VQLWHSMILVGLLASCHGARTTDSPRETGTDTGALGPVALPVIALPSELDRVLRDYERAWQAGDGETLAALFTEDGFVLSNGAPAVRGRDAIRKTYAGARGDLCLRALAYSINENTGYIVGLFWYGNEPSITEKGKFLLALRRPPGNRWMIAADMDNSSHWKK